MLNLDTHVLIYALAGQLTAKERRLLESESWSISTISLWEIAKLVQLGRIDEHATCGWHGVKRQATPPRRG